MAPDKRWRFALVIVVVWFGIVAYMGSGVSEYFTTQVVSERLQQTTSMLVKSQLLGKKLKNDVRLLRERIAKLEKACPGCNTISETRTQSAAASQSPAKAKRAIKATTTTTTTTTTGPDFKLERTRRRATKELREMWYYLSAEVTRINRKVGNEKTRARLTHMLEQFADIHRALTNNLEVINNRADLKAWRELEHSRLSNLVQNRIHGLQNPSNCQAARKLVCELNKGCGYGCQVHHLFYCFLTAYGSNRTLILDSQNWRYSPDKGWEGVFEPVSQTCTSVGDNVEMWSPETQNSPNILLPIVDNVTPKPKHLPLAVPSDLVNRIKLLHGFPFVWWIGQFAKYLFRYKPEVQKEIDEKKKKLGFKYPIVGVHVRRTDKVNLEAAYHGLDEYMYWVDLFFKKLEAKQHVEKRRVYLATDDASVLSEAVKKYPNYEFISDNDISKSANLMERYTDKSLHGVIFDIDMLSQCDYLVCTFSSQVCRVAYEMMQTRVPDASDNVQSLDDVYYFGGQSVNDVQSVYPYKASKPNEISFEAGVRIQIAGNHWDGYSKGTSIKDWKTGLFPSYLVEKHIHIVDFPDYSHFDKGVK